MLIRIPLLVGVRHPAQLRKRFLLMLSSRRCARQRFVALREVSTGLARRRYVLGAGTLQYLLRSLGPVRAVAVHRQQNATGLHSAFVALGFVFRDAHSDRSE